MGKKFWVDFSGSMLIFGNDKMTIEDVKAEFFRILNSYNYYFEPQFDFVEIEKVEEARVLK